MRSDCFWSFIIKLSYTDKRRPRRESQEGNRAGLERREIE